MNANAVAGDGLRLVSQLVGAAISVPVVVGFVALGAGVIAGRSLLDVARQTWSRLPSLGGNQGINSHVNQR